MTTEIPAGDFYDCRDPEHLLHESPEEAIEEYLDSWMSKDCDVSASIRACSPLEVTAWSRKKPDDKWLVGIAGRVLDKAHQAFVEEFCTSDDGDHITLEDVDLKGATPAMVEVLRAFFAKTIAYDCDRVGVVTLDAAEVEAMMREHRPDWWEKP